MAEAAQEAAVAMLEEPGVEATETVEQPAEEPIPSFEADTSGIEDLLKEPDFDEDPEPVYAQPDETLDEYPDVEQLQAQLEKTRKQLEYEKGLRVENSRKAWREEGARRFPFADVDEIDATSRRAFLRKAAEQHDRIERKLEPILSKIDSLRTQVIQETKDETRAQAVAAWGDPVSGPQVPTVVAAEDEAKLDRKQYRTPLEAISARLKHDPRFKDGI